MALTAEEWRLLMDAFFLKARFIPGIPIGATAGRGLTWPDDRRPIRHLTPTLLVDLDGRYYPSAVAPSGAAPTGREIVVPTTTYDDDADFTPVAALGEPTLLRPVNNAYGRWHTYTGSITTAASAADFLDRAGTAMQAAPTGQSWQIGEYSVSLVAINSHLTQGLHVTARIESKTTATLVAGIAAVADAAPAAVVQTAGSAELSGYSGRALPATEIAELQLGTSAGTVASIRATASIRARLVA